MNCSDDIVYFDPKTQKEVTLKEYAKEAHLHHNDLSIDHLGVQADNTMFKRFDIFNQKYNPLGMSKLREIFLKSENYMKGRYLAEMT